MNGSVTIQIDAPPAEVWQVVSDITRIGELSPETFEAEWLDGASGPALGAKFRGHVKRNGIGPVYWTTCEVTACEPGVEFGFVVLVSGRPANNWHYELAPAGSGTAITESFTLPPSRFSRIYWAVAGWRRGRTNERGMRQTLERVKAIAEG